MGPVLAPSKNHRCHRAFLDDGTADLLRRFFRDLSSERQGRERFVFTSDVCGVRPWLPNWVTKRFIDLRTGAASFTSGCTTCGTSWLPKCSTPASLSRSSPNDSHISATRRPSTTTRTPFRVEIVPPLSFLATFCDGRDKVSTATRQGRYVRQRKLSHRPGGMRPVAVNLGSAIFRIVRFGPVRWLLHQCRGVQDVWLRVP